MSFRLRMRKRYDEGEEDEEEEGEEATEMAKDIKRRIRVMRLKKKELELKKSLDELGGDRSKDDTGDILTPSIAMELAKLSDEERSRVIETYAMLRSADKTGAGAAMIPMMIGFAKANPGATQGSMVEFAKVMGDQFSRGVETVKGIVPPREKADDPMRFLDFVKELIKESVNRPIEEALKQLRPQPSVFEQILLDDKLFVRARELGIFGRHETGGRGNIDLEIERLRGERELQVKKLELDWRKAMLEHEAGERRTEALLSTVAPLGALFAGPVDQKMRQLGQRAAAQPPAPVKAPPVPKNVVHIRCTCGHREAVSFEGEPPKSIKCPACGLELVVGGAPPGEAEEPDRGA